MNKAVNSALAPAIPGAGDAVKRRSLLDHLWARLALFGLVALAMRGATFGDPTVWFDEQFYFLVGQKMGEGELPYVDIWDRKPPGLFLLYFLFAQISHSVLTYQLAACLSVVATAEIIARLGKHYAAPTGGALAGVIYIVMLNCLQGYGGQAQLFYNPLVAGGALLTIRSLPDAAEGRFPRALAAAMLLFGTALTMKQTAIAEVAWFGLLTAASSRSAKTALICMALGLVPMLLVSLPWLAHWPEFWHAMVTSNLAKGYRPDGAQWILVGTARILVALITAALVGLVISRSKLMAGWIAFAAIGFFVNPRFYAHYALPLLVPLCVAAAPLFERKLLGRLAAAVTVAFAFLFQWPFDLAYHRHSREAFDDFTAAIKATGGRTMFVYEGPTYLYASTGLRHLSPLVFPHHWNHLIEADVSHLKTSDELRRTLAQHPDVVVMFPKPISHPINLDALRQVRAYVSPCRLGKRSTIYEGHGAFQLDLWDCTRRHERRGDV